MTIETWAAGLLFLYSLLMLVALIVNAVNGKGHAVIINGALYVVTVGTALGLLGLL